MKPKLQYFSHGPFVVELQTKLNVLMPGALPPLKVDGVYGDRTVARVKQFQKSRGLIPDGVVGAQTWAAVDGTISEFHRAVRSGCLIAEYGPDRSSPQREEGVHRVANQVLVRLGPDHSHGGASRTRHHSGLHGLCQHHGLWHMRIEEEPQIRRPLHGSVHARRITRYLHPLHARDRRSVARLCSRAQTGN